MKEEYFKLSFIIIKIFLLNNHLFHHAYIRLLTSNKFNISLPIHNRPS